MVQSYTKNKKTSVKTEVLGGRYVLHTRDQIAGTPDGSDQTMLLTTLCTFIERIFCPHI